MIHPDLDIAPDVADALSQGGAVVALESTIIAHGMPYPGNVVTARAVEHIIRNEGAVPATIAVLGGKLKVGLSEAELEQVAQSPDMAKASVRDLPVLIAAKRDGATTVASTMRIAAMAGIRVFATGGIGGVHRGVETTADVSADLTELAQSPVAVISAGAKAILDLPRTLEMLETLSVPVIGYQCDEFPAFYSRSSGLPIPARADSPEEIAGILAARWRLSNVGGVLIANPIPGAEEIPADRIEQQIAAALRDAAARGVAGKEVTPFLLARIRDLTQGASQRANVALVLNNAQVGAKIARALSAIVRKN
jgi:pseudouridylate synthase